MDTMPLALLIDDMAANNQMMGIYLKRYGLDSMVITTGFEGYELAQQTPPDIIFIDLIMPTKGWNGYDTIKKFRKNPDLSHIPIIAMSAAGDKEEALISGANDFLQRPYNFEHVESVLSIYLPSRNQQET